MKIKFNQVYTTGKEIDYIQQAIANKHLSGDGSFTKKCTEFLQNRYQFKKCLLTTSCTDALEMAAILLDIKQGDEIIMPSYTFVSTANAFVLRGAKIIFADSQTNNPNIDVESIEALITPRTKALVMVHYAGVACDMDKIMEIANKHQLFVVEDAAQAIDGYYKGKPLGSLGHLGAFSFHETKNIIAGEGGMLAINDERFLKRAEIIREKGTNRSAFFRGEVDKYGWVDIGSSFLPSELIAAFLLAQLENIDDIQNRRKSIWKRYQEGLQNLEQEGKIQLTHIPDYASHNAHLFYIICKDLAERTALLAFLKENEIQAVFHYLALEKSKFYEKDYHNESLPNSAHFTDGLVRLPFYYELKEDEQDFVISKIQEFYKTS
jgi:dTDP-4-amino-4,6-dideoxygalactose transaminase